MPGMHSHGGDEKKGKLNKSGLKSRMKALKKKRKNKNIDPGSSGGSKIVKPAAQPAPPPPKSKSDLKKKGSEGEQLTKQGIT